jgi:hypothetical protein
MKKISKLLSCLTAFSVLAGVPVLPAQAETLAYAFTAEDVQRTYNTRFYEEFRNINTERIQAAYESGRDAIANAADTIHSYFAGVAFIWHGEGTPQGVTFGDYQPEWIDKGRVNGENPKITTAQGYLTDFARLDDPNWPNPENELDYSWTEPTEITQASETIYLAGAELTTQDRVLDHCFDCAKTAEALMADERVEIIGLMFGINTRPAQWERETNYYRGEIPVVPDGYVPVEPGGYLMCNNYVKGYNYSAEIIPIRHFESIRGDLSNADNKILLEDVLSAAELYNGILLDIAQPTSEQLETADINGDGIIDLTDLLAILQYYNYNEILGITVTYDDIINNKV